MRHSSAVLLVLCAVVVPGCPAASDPPAQAPPAHSPDEAEASKGAASAKAPARPAPDAAAKEPAPPAKPEPEREGKHFTYADEVATLEKNAKAAYARAKKNARSPEIFATAADRMLALGRLTGNYDHFATAEAWVAESFGIKLRRGAHLTRAKINYHLHRLDQVDEDIEGATPTAIAGGKQGVAALRTFEGKVAFQRGDYETAVKKWDEASALDPPSDDIARAVYFWRTGDFAQAEKGFAHYSRNYHGARAEPAAWLDLMMGILDLERGRYEDALEHCKDASADLEGYWLIDEHVAEITTLLGKLEEAEAMYREIIERTNNPEFMDALAGILSETGREDEAATWVGKARARYKEQLAQYPEAAYGHALGHYLEFGPPKEALELARKNHALRPNGDAKTKLAEAELAMGNVDAAMKVVEDLLATPWSTADSHYVAHQVLKAAGEDERAAAQLDKAKAINPKIAD